MKCITDNDLKFLLFQNNYSLLLIINLPLLESLLRHNYIPVVNLNIFKYPILSKFIGHICTMPCWIFYQSFIECLLFSFTWMPLIKRMLLEFVWLVADGILHLISHWPNVYLLIRRNKSNKYVFASIL